VVYQLIYTSSAAKDLDDFALREIAQTSIYNNQLIGVTGLLLFHQGSILQILEGDKDSVTSLYETVKQDKRHSGCMLLSTRIAKQREFSDWFMGYKNVSAEDGGSSLFNLTQSNLQTVLPKDPSAEIAALTKTYQRVSGF
jgi:hypothetical protein